MTDRTIRGRRAEAGGRRAETLARLFLRLKGYRILDRRWRSPSGEIDLIVRRGGTLAFVEVKYRPRLTDAAHAITPTQQNRISRTARDYLAAHPDLAHHTMRFDVLLMAPGHWPRHWRHAWLTDGF